MEKEESQRHVFGPLTGMRGIACLSIVCFHYFCLYFGNLDLEASAAPFAPASELFFTYSKNAVELFFMISGFLTAHHYRDRIASMSPLAYVRKRYAKLIVPSVIVTLWALANAQAFLQSVPGSDAFVEPITPLRVILSMLMLNTGWVASYAETALPINSTMWFVDVLLLCYLLYYPLSRLAKNRSVYLCACTLMVLLGWVCLEHPPGLPFLWLIDGRGYATFFLGVLLYEFHDQAAERVRKGVSVVWGTLILGFLATRMVIGFEEVFGDVGSSSYVRYFEFVVAPGMLMCALNLPVASKVLEWRPLLWLGALSGAIYYVHNNIMEDYFILDSVCGTGVDFSSGLVFLAVVASVIPFACLWQCAARHLRRLVDTRRAA